MRRRALGWPAAAGAGPARVIIAVCLPGGRHCSAAIIHGIRSLARVPRVTEQAAVACAHTMGQGDRHGSDQVAVEAMRREMDTVPIDGTVVIGEGERDEAPMLYIGEKVGLAHKDQPPTASGTRSTLPSTRWKARTCAPPARPTPLRCWRPPRKAACCTRPISTWRSWSSDRASKHVVELDAPVRDNLRAIARSLAARSTS